MKPQKLTAKAALPKDEWGFRVNSKTGFQELMVPRKAAFSFGEMITVQMAVVDLLKTVQEIILAQVTGKRPDGKPIGKVKK